MISYIVHQLFSKLKSDAVSIGCNPFFIEKRFVIESNRENFYGEIIKENSGYAVRKDEKKKI